MTLEWLQPQEFAATLLTGGRLPLSALEIGVDLLEQVWEVEAYEQQSGIGKRLWIRTKKAVLKV